MTRAFLGLWVLGACVQKPPAALRPTPPPPERPRPAVDARGVWMGTLASSSGPVPLRVEVSDEAAPVLVLQDQRFPGRGSRTGNQVQWRFPSVGAVLRGSLDGDGFRGRFEQLGRSLPLHLDRERGGLGLR